MNLNSFKKKGLGLGSSRVDRTGDNEAVLERVTEVCEQLFDLYRSTLAPDTIAEKYEEAINLGGFQFLGRGQNRVAFRNDGSGFVYKVPFREVGLRDNAIEREVASLIATNEQCYKDLAAHAPMVTDFSLGDGYENFCICAEFIENLVSNDMSVGTQEETSIYATVEHYEVLSELLRKFNEYFHISDCHLVLASTNFGVKDGEFAIRDLGYFIPRIGDFESLTDKIDNTPVEYRYLTLDMLPLTSEEKKSVYKRIAKFKTISEMYAPFDINGNLVGNDDDFVDAADCMANMLGKYQREYL